MTAPAPSGPALLRRSRRRDRLAGVGVPLGLALALLFQPVGAPATNGDLAAQKAEAEKEYWDAWDELDESGEEFWKAREAEKDAQARFKEAKDTPAERLSRQREIEMHRAGRRRADAHDRKRAAEERYRRAKKRLDRIEEAERRAGGTKPAEAPPPTPGDAPASPPSAPGAPPATAAGGPVEVDPRAPAPAGGGSTHAGGVTMHTLPDGDVILARGGDQVRIAAGDLRGVAGAQAAVDRALADPGAVPALQALVDEAFRAGNDAALSAVVFDLQGQPDGSALAAVRDHARAKLDLLGAQGSAAARAALAAIDRRAEILKAQDAGHVVSDRLEANAGTLVDSGWEGVAIFDYHVTLSYVTQLHTLAYSDRSPQEQEALTAQLVSLFDETRTLERLLEFPPHGLVRFGDTVYLEPVGGGNVLVRYVVPPGQATQPRDVSSTDATGQVLIGRADGEIVELDGQSYRVKIVRSTLDAFQAAAIAQTRLGAVQGEIQGLLAVPGLQAPMPADERARLEAELPGHATAVRQRDAVLADKERRLAAAERELRAAQAHLATLEQAARGPLPSRDDAFRQQEQAAIEAARAEVAERTAARDAARAERDRARHDRDAALTSHPILGVEVDGQPLYVHLATLPAGDTGGSLIERARVRQVELTQQGLVWWGTEATLSEKVAFAGVLRGTQQRILTDPGLQAVFGPSGLRARLEIVVGAGDAAELAKAERRLEGDVVLTILAIPSVFVPPLGIALAITGAGKAAAEHQQDTATAGRMEAGAQSGLASRVAIGDRNRPPSVGFLVLVIGLEVIGGAGDLVATLGKGAGAAKATAAADAAAGGADVAAAGDAARAAAGADGSRAGASAGASSAPRGPPAAGGAPPGAAAGAVTAPGAAGSAGGQLTVAGPPGAPPRTVERGAPIGAGGMGAVSEARVVGGAPQQNAGFTVRFQVGDDSIKPGVVVEVRVEPLPADGNVVVKEYTGPPDAARQGLQAEVEGANFLSDAGVAVPAIHGVGGLDGGTPFIVRERIGGHPLSGDFGSGARTPDRPPSPDEGPVSYFPGDRTLHPAEQAAVATALRQIDDAGGAMPDAFRDGNWALRIHPDGRVEVVIVDTQFAGRFDDPFVEGQTFGMMAGVYSDRPAGFDELLSLDQQNDIFGNRGLTNAYTAHRFGLVIFDPTTGTWGGRVAPDLLGQALGPFGQYRSMFEDAWRQSGIGAAAPPATGRPPGQPGTLPVSPPTAADSPLGVSAPATGSPSPAATGPSTAGTGRPPGTPATQPVPPPSGTEPPAAVARTPRPPGTPATQRVPAPSGTEAPTAGARVAPPDSAPGAADAPTPAGPVTAAPAGGPAGPPATRPVPPGSGAEPSGGPGPTPSGGAAPAAGAGSPAPAARLPLAPGRPAPATPGPASSGAGPAARGAAAGVRGAGATEPERGDARDAGDAAPGYPAPRDSRVSLVPGPDGRLRFALRFDPTPWRILELPSGVPAAARRGFQQSLPLLLPGIRRVDVPDGPRETGMAYTFPASELTVRLLEAWLRRHGVSYRLEDEALMAVQAPGPPCSRLAAGGRSADAARP